jgi:hypothetical protein
LEVRPPSEFSYESAKGKLANLRFGDSHALQRKFIVPGDIILDEPDYGDEKAPGQQGRMLHLSGLVDMGSSLTVSDFYSYLTYYHLTNTRSDALEHFSHICNVGVQLHFSRAPRKCISYFAYPS